MNEIKLTYKNESGEEVFTSDYLLKRASCCKTNCLHCPYGHTLKTFSIELSSMEKKHIRFANEIIKDSRPIELSELATSILSSGFGKKDKIGVHHVTEDNLHNFSFGMFKGFTCAVVEFSTRLSESSSGYMIKNLFLKKEFQKQGLEIGHIKEK